MTEPPPRLRIATRASRLAVWQANHVAALLRRVAPHLDVQIVEVSTHGDQERTEPLSQMGGVGVFTREIQHAVMDERADVAVHSLKDLPTEAATGLALAGVPKRGPRFDALVLPDDVHPSVGSLDDLPSAARVGTGSPRRQAQLLSQRPDLRMAEIRGNVETRLRKLDAGEYHAIVLAQAGLERLGLETGRRLIPLVPPLMYPAVGQAALGLECRSDDEATIALLQSITDDATQSEVTAERACLRGLRAGCHAPVGTLTQIEGETLTLDAVVLSADGTERIEGRHTGDVAAAEEIGAELARTLLEGGAERLIETL